MVVFHFKLGKVDGKLPIWLASGEREGGRGREREGERERGRERETEKGDLCNAFMHLQTFEHIVESQQPLATSRRLLLLSLCTE